MIARHAVWYVNHAFEVTKEELCNSGRFDEAKEFEIAQNMAIEALQDDWISITEAEPNTPDHVLVTYKWGNDDYEVSELDYWITKYEAENGNAQCKRLIDHVIAWRYMLAPYKGGDTE